MSLPIHSQLDHSHEPSLQSWVVSANSASTDFPIQNLPFGRLRRAASAEAWRIGVAIGDQVLDLAAAAATPGWSEQVQAWLIPLVSGDLNAFMALGPIARKGMREALSLALREGSSQADSLQPCLLAQNQIELSLPCQIGDYTDFYTGIHHATTVGKLFRPDNPLLPNYKWVPIGYHGRSSSIVVSGSDVRRPNGQLKGAADAPSFGPSQRLDYELELGVLIGQGNELGQTIPMASAEEHIFGLCLLNDWSARDMQAWEYQPLGPFLAKNFASTISPWVVTLEALAPFRAPFSRPEADPQPLPYLDSPANRSSGQFDITLEVWLQTKQMAEQGQAAVRLSLGNLQEAAYWTLAQLVTHHAAGGCNLRAGDLFGSGTLSGPQPDQAGSLLELSLGGKNPLSLPNGETRTFLQDGDTVTLRAYCEKSSARRIGLGECVGTIQAATAVV